MARYQRVFISFAIEDQWAARYLAGQAKDERSPFAFIDMSVKNPWDEAWKTQCRARIRGCDGMIAFVSTKTARADGALWEIRCAKAERIPLIGMYTTTDSRPMYLPADLAGVRVVDWTWPNIKAFIDRL